MFASVESIRFEIEDHFINKHFLSIFSENRRVLNLTMVRAWNDRITYLWFWHFVNSCDRNSSVFGMSWGLSYGIYHLDFSLAFFFWSFLIEHFWQARNFLLFQRLMQWHNIVGIHRCQAIWILRVRIWCITGRIQAIVCWYRMSCIKGQLISKGLFCVIVCTKKPTKYFSGFLP